MIICNLFFIFDPSLRLFSRAWLILFVFILLPIIIFLCSNISNYFFILFTSLTKEISFRVPKIIKGYNSFLISLFILILLYNFLALFPHFFSPTSHLLVTIPLAYCVWTAVIFFNLFSYFKFVTTHFIPLGTPIFFNKFHSYRWSLKKFNSSFSFNFSSHSKYNSRALTYVFNL